jgi:hypothetical protein
LVETIQEASSDRVKPLWLLHVYAMTGIGHNLASRARDSRLDGSGMGMDVRDVVLADDDERGDADLAETAQGARLRPLRELICVQVVRVRGQQLSHFVLRRRRGRRDIVRVPPRPVLDRRACRQVL